MSGGGGLSPSEENIDPRPLFLRGGLRAAMRLRGKTAEKDGGEGECSQCCHTLRIFAILANLRV